MLLSEKQEQTCFKKPILYEQQVLLDTHSLAKGKVTLMASFLLGTGTPLNYYLDNISLEEIKPFCYLFTPGMWVSILFISFWVFKDIIDSHSSLIRRGWQEQKATGNSVQVLLLMSCLSLILFRDQVLEIIPSNEEQIKSLVQLEAEEHLQVFVQLRLLFPSESSDRTTDSQTVFWLLWDSVG